jgi:hypothetical protein
MIRSAGQKVKRPAPCLQICGGKWRKIGDPVASLGIHSQHSAVPTTKGEAVFLPLSSPSQGKTASLPFPLAENTCSPVEG